MDLLNTHILWGVMLSLGRQFRTFRAFETWVSFYPQTQRNFPEDLNILFNSLLILHSKISFHVDLYEYIQSVVKSSTKQKWAFLLYISPSSHP